MSALLDLHTIPQEHLEPRDVIRQIAEAAIAPRAAEMDQRALRDAKKTQIHEGTNQIQRRAIARTLR